GRRVRAADDAERSGVHRRRQDRAPHRAEEAERSSPPDDPRRQGAERPGIRRASADAGLERARRRSGEAERERDPRAHAPAIGAQLHTQAPDEATRARRAATANNPAIALGSNRSAGLASSVTQAVERMVGELGIPADRTAEATAFLNKLMLRGQDRSATDPG